VKWSNPNGYNRIITEIKKINRDEEDEEDQDKEN